MTFHPLRTLVLASLTISPLIASAENWGNWRGPVHNGSSPEKNLPATWGENNGVKWSTPLPGFSGATPAIWGDSVFVSSPDDNKDLLLFCLDRNDGKVRWQKKLATGNIVKGRGNMASPSPVTDGKTVFALFGTGDIAALDFKGQVLWQRNLGEDYGRFSIMWIYGSSPLLHGGKLYIQVLQRTPAPPDYPGIGGGAPERESYLLALNPADGKTVWKQVRPTDARMESMESYASPIPHIAKDGSTQILVVGGDVLSGHDAATGAELWRGGGLNRKRGEWMRIVPSAVSAAGLAIACGPKKEPLIAFRTDLRGDITASGVAWTMDERKTPDVCTPAVYDGKLFVLDGDSQTLMRLDPATGKVKWQGQLPDRTVIRSSPTVADGKVYIVNEKGTVFVCRAGDEFQMLSTIPMGGSEATRSSIAIADGALFIRLAERIVCVGK